MILFILLKIGTLLITWSSQPRERLTVCSRAKLSTLSQLCLDVEYWSSSAPELNPKHPVLLTSTLSIRLIVSHRPV